MLGIVKSLSIDCFTSEDTMGLSPHLSRAEGTQLNCNMNPAVLQEGSSIVYLFQLWCNL